MARRLLPFPFHREIPKHLLGRKLPKRRNGSSHEDGDEIEDDKNKHPHADYLLLGINAVTKALEKGPLSLVLVRSRLFFNRNFEVSLAIVGAKKTAVAKMGFNSKD